MSSIRPSQARREAYSRLPESCPKVANQMARAIGEYLNGCGLLGDDTDVEALTKAIVDVAMDEVVIHGTTPLREALIECEMERLVVQDRVDDLEGDLSSARNTIVCLERDIDGLNDDLTDALNRPVE